MKCTKRDKSKDIEFVFILQIYFGKNINLGRIKFIALFLCYLCKA